MDFVGEYKDKRLGNLFNLLTSGAKVRLDDYGKSYQPSIKYLLKENILKYDDQGFLSFEDLNVARFLHDLYYRGSALLWSYPQSVKEWIVQKVKAGDLELGSSLLSRPEQDWLSYYWDNSKFSNSLAIRNRYAHGRKYGTNAENDYLIVLMITSILVVKIYSDLSIAKMLKDAGEEKELDMNLG